MRTLVSVLIPAHNAGRWIRRTLDSVAAQDWPWIETIVVDDGSTDSTPNIVKEFESTRVKLVFQDAAGAAAARNRAYSVCQGQYIQWLDADDVLMPYKIRRQLERAFRSESNLNLFSSSWGQFLGSPEEARFEPTALWRSLAPSEWLRQKMLTRAWMAIQCWLVSRDLCDRAGPWDESLSRDDDGEYFARVIASSDFVEFVPDAYSACQRGHLSLSHQLTLTRQKEDSQARSVLKQVGIALELDFSEDMKRAAMDFLSECSIDFYPARRDLLEWFRERVTMLGGELLEPHLRPPYDMIRRYFGWRLAKALLRWIPSVRSSVRSLNRRLRLYVR